MTNEQAKGYVTCALYAIHRNKGRQGYGRHRATDKQLRELIKEVRDEMHWQFDVLTEEETEERGDHILNQLASG